MVFDDGEFLFREGQPAEQFYVVRHGRVAVWTFAPDRGAITIETVGEGEVLGWSWLFPPYHWHFSRAGGRTGAGPGLGRRLPARQVREDPVLGYELMERFAQVMVQRLEATRLQLMDVYGSRV